MVLKADLSSSFIPLSFVDYAIGVISQILPLLRSAYSLSSLRFFFIRICMHIHMSTYCTYTCQIYIALTHSSPTFPQSPLVSHSE